MSSLRRFVAVAGLAIAMAVSLGTVASADHVRAIAEIGVAHAEKLEKGYVITAKLRGSDGRPLNSATVRFYESVELFGAREMFIASALTDGQGNASIPYLPARLGQHELIVRFPGRDHIGASVTKHTFEATVAVAPYRQATPPLAAFSANVPYGVGVVLLSVWALIAFALFGTMRGVLQGARDPAIRKGDTA
ncbi:MAG TPA: hypothetical protein VFQ66_02780 [Candidatus Limnocylindria bacterium]|nr:hypothetical protein [Candidatus Limnocylindria bacterium]